jgi:thioredoxin reductase/Fe-S-cluster-containing hydrogenase component 2/CRP-like cAMP-binding protein
MSQHFEVAIIGAGPGGIGAAANAAACGLSHILFEKSQIANTIYDYQLHKHVMAEPARLPLRAKCRFEAGSREKILKEFEEDLSSTKVNVIRAEVTKIQKLEEGFEIHYQGQKCTAKHVILAVGVQGTPRKLGVPGEELPHIAYTLADPGAFKGRNIIIVGAGDAAIENAVALSEHNSVSLVNRGGEFARAKDANTRLILNAISSGKIRCFYNATVARIESSTTHLNTPEGEVAIPCDHIIARLGGIPPRKFLESIGIQFPNSEASAVPVVNDRYESNVPGLFIIGALIGYPLIKQAINQGHEVIEHLRGQPVEPADQPLLEERFQHLPGSFKENSPKISANLPLFKDLSSPQLREMLIDSHLHLKQPEEIIFNKNDYTDSFWSIVEGSVEIEIDATRRVNLSRGQFFGEMGLLSGRRRVATVRVAEPNTLLLETPRKQVLKLLASVNSVRRALDELFMLRAMQTSIFPDAPRELLESLAKKATIKSFKKGEVLFKEGDVGDVMYVIRKGSVKVSRQSRQGVDVAQAYVPAGHIVGEMAIVEQGPTARSATVSAAVACETIALQKADVHDLFAQYPQVHARVTNVADERRIQNAVADWSEDSASIFEFMMREGLTDAENVLLIDSDLCVGCDNCETACAATHGGYSRLDRKGGKSFASIQIPISCRHCENPLCMLDCPPDALTRMPNGEVVIRDSCIGCGNCVSNCPYGVIKMVYDSVDTGWSLRSLLGLGKKEKGPAKAAKCDMCRDLSGGPSCVRACPTGAAMRVNSARLVQIAASKRIE